MFNVIVFGATGYTGHEVTRILAQHPKAQIKALTSESSAGKDCASQLRIPSNQHQRCLPAAFETAAEALKHVARGSISFLCLPHGESATTAAAIIERGGRVIDLSADFRLQSLTDYRQWYNQDHPFPELLHEAQYGLCELNENPLVSTRILANPGCYPTSIILALAPLLKSNLVLTDGIIIDSKSGTSGAGRSPKVNLLFSECTENFSAYSPGKSHRHVPEINAGLEQFGNMNITQKIDVLFTPHLLPVHRGILSTIYCKLVAPNTQRQEILHAWKAAYSLEKSKPFIFILEEGLPDLSFAVRTNRCAMGFQIAGDTLIIVSVIDNLLKGAAGQAVQNFNRMIGAQDTLGLESLL